MAKRIVTLNENQLFDVFKNALNEIYSDKDMSRGTLRPGTYDGIKIDFPGDMRKERLIIKKLVRLKAQLPDEYKQKIEDILVLMVGD